MTQMVQGCVCVYPYIWAPTVTDLALKKGLQAAYISITAFTDILHIGLCAMILV